MIHYISPFRRDKNIGLAINDAVKTLMSRGEDWIVLTDHDTLFLLPDTKLHIEEILGKTECDILGCKTNRVGVPEQLLQGAFLDFDGIREHIRIARDVWEGYGDQIRSTNGPVAAFMLCFRVRTWLKLSGFDEGVLNFDTLFAHKARLMGFKTGIMQGIYVWHSYRLESPAPRKDIKHLLP